MRTVKPVTATDWHELPILLRVSDLQTFFGIPRPSAYAIAHNLGRRIGRSMVIPRDVFRAWIEGGAKIA